MGDSVPDLDFQVEEALALRYAASPTLVFKVRVTNTSAETINSVMLRCQIMLAATARRYSDRERARLLELFGEPERWNETLRSTLWTNTNTIVPSFTGSTIVDLLVPCTFDFNVAATKFFAGLEDGTAPLNMLFSGTVFYARQDGSLQITQIPWEKEAGYRLPVSVWKEMMDLYYPNSAWLNLRRDIFERLYHYKIREGFPTWEQAIESLLPALESDSEERKNREAVH